jgi:hypothetical protein
VTGSVPRLWRPRSDSLPTIPDPSGDGEPEWVDVLVDRLTRLADDGRSGSLRVSGRRGGEIVFVDGRIVVAEAPTAPSAEVLLLHAVDGNQHGWETLARNGIQQARNYARTEAARLATAGSISALRLEAIVHAATVDAVTELCRGEQSWQAGWRFRSGQGHWLGDVRPLEVPTVVREVDRRRAILEQIQARVAPESVLVRAPRLPLSRLQLSAAQWDLIRTTDGASSVCSLAWVLGRGIFATTLEAYALIRLGVLATTDAPAEDPLPIAPLHRRPELSFRDGQRGRSTVLVADTHERGPTPHRRLQAPADVHAALPMPFGSDDHSAPTTKEFRP